MSPSSPAVPALVSAATRMSRRRRGRVQRAANWAAAAPPINEDAQRIVDDIVARNMPSGGEKRVLSYRRATDEAAWAAVWAEPETGGEG